MASLQSTHPILPRPFSYQLTPFPPNHRTLIFYRRFPVSRLRILSWRERCLGKYRGGCKYLIGCKANNAEIDKVDVEERPPFDINLAVVLAGFAFEAYTTPPENIGRREIDAVGCKTVYLSESFVREIYDGQLFIQLKKGIELPIMDPWGTSDPYVVLQLDGQYAKSKIKWGNKEPTWNEEFTFNIKQSPTKNLQVAAWDANLITPHKRMGNASINLESLCDGNLHELLVELEGMGGGGKLQLEVNYKTFDEIAEEKKWWKLPFVSEFLRKNSFESAMKSVGSESVPARQFVEYAFGQLKDRILKSDDSEGAEKLKNSVMSETGSEMQNITEASFVESETSHSTENNSDLVQTHNGSLDKEHAVQVVTQAGETVQSEKDFWKNFADTINQTVVQKLGPSIPLDLKWDSMELLKGIGLQSQRDAEAGYIESGLATPDGQDVENEKSSSPVSISKIQSSIPDIKKVTQELLGQTDSILGAFMVMTAAVSKLNKDGQKVGKGSSETENLISSLNESVIDEKKAEEMRKLFSTAETAMEAWAMLATSLGQASFIKSEFEKICFLDNETTDTQVAIWRDSARRRLVVAFRGTEQSKWKDLRTDLMLAPAGLNPERIGGDFKQEVQVHSGFLHAYDSVRIRIISVIKLAIGFPDDAVELQDKWHVYVTGHSLGGALATLFALELSSSLLAKRAAISVTMYNFGSPRVGNRRFAEVYNQRVKDSWRVVNHRDIIPTVPRLMGYCHVAHPVYLAAGELKDALENMELMKDGYQIDVIGEYTPDVIVDHFMKGEKELLEKILQTEINIFRSIRDGSALMQHMEDFYYITLLENVRSNYQTAARMQSNEKDSVTISR